jgi:cytochrome c peroxidase
MADAARRRRLPAFRLRYLAAGMASTVVLGASTALWAAGVVPAGAMAEWFSPGEARTLPVTSAYENAHGKVGLLSADGAVQTKGHAFFEPIGTNGRACVTCHQPAQGMSVSAEQLQARWKATSGRDPVFAAVDGSNCPTLPQHLESSHSLLLERGLFRIALAWPPKNPEGGAIKPEFDIEVVRDPTGCNSGAVYGINGSKPAVSVYRRARPVGNLKFVAASGGILNARLLNVKTGYPLDRDPETGDLVSMTIMADARNPTLKAQALEAGFAHLQMKQALTKSQLDQILTFERQLYVAQSHDRWGNSLEGGTAKAGPKSLLEGRRVAGDSFVTPVFPYFTDWEDAAKNAHLTAEQREFRASVVRGNRIFLERPIWIRDSTHMNTVGLGNPLKRTCTTCHNGRHSGMEMAPGYIDIGTTNAPWAKESDELPLFKLTCHKSARPHPFLGRVIYTQDPGRALISGLCADIGSITTQQMRALAARAPYFSNGSAANLGEIVDFYNRRFNIGFTDQERQDLINFLSVL